MHRSSILHPRSSSRTAFTLLEVMVVAVVVVLMLGMALPVFRVITGSRSEAGAANIIASTLGRARTDALGLQKTIGVAFIYNPNSQAQTMAEVELVSVATWSSTQQYIPGQCVNYATGGSSPYYYCIQTNTGQTPTTGSSGTYWLQVGGPPIEIRADTSPQPLPTGIGVQTIANCNYSSIGGSTRVSDGYLSIGVILFDAQGRLTSAAYGISSGSRLATTSGLTKSYPSSYKVISGSSYGVASQFGLVVFQKDAYSNQRSSTPDALYTDDTPTPVSSTTSLTDYTAGTPTQQAEEAWLDQNATPLLIDRYTGTLIKAE